MHVFTGPLMFLFLASAVNTFHAPESQKIKNDILNSASFELPALSPDFPGDPISNDENLPIEYVVIIG